jgi:hypothetical protein
MICVLRKTAKNRDSKNQRAVQRERYRSGTGHRSGTVRAVQRGIGAVQDTKRGTERGTERGTARYKPRYRSRGTGHQAAVQRGTGHPHFGGAESGCPFLEEAESLQSARGGTRGVYDLCSAKNCEKQGQQKPESGTERAVQERYRTPERYSTSGTARYKRGTGHQARYRARYRERGTGHPHFGGAESGCPFLESNIAASRGALCRGRLAVKRRLGNNLSAAARGHDLCCSQLANAVRQNADRQV